MYCSRTADAGFFGLLSGFWFLSVTLQVRFRQNSMCQELILLAGRTLEKAFLDSGKLDLGLVSAGSKGIEP